MSRKGNCYDNATMESFWSSLKLEVIYRRDFVIHNQARSEIFDYIESGICKNVTPLRFAIWVWVGGQGPIPLGP